MIGITIKDIVIKSNISIAGDASLQETIALMNENKKGVAVIVESGTPRGILTERDVVRLLYQGVDTQKTVYGHSRKQFITIRCDRTVHYALTLMIENNIRRLIVVDEQKSFVGVVTQQDLVVYLEEDYYRAKIQVRDIRSAIGDLISLPPDATLFNAYEQMVRNNISSLPILEGGRVAGIITEKDVLRLSLDSVTTATPIRLCMSHPVTTVTLDTTLSDVAKLMGDNNIRRVVITNQDGKAIGMVTDRDLVRNFESDYRAFIENKLRHSRDILNLLPELLLEITDTDREQIVIWANEKAIGRFGMGVVDHPVTDIIPASEWPHIHGMLLKNAKVEDIQFRKDEAVFEVSGFLLRTDIHAEQGRIQLILRDISENVKLSTTDALTGLFNRRFLNEFLMKEIARSARVKKRFVVALADLDEFKTINDTRSHAAGDAVLKWVALVMCKNMRNADIIARYGGDEFVLIMPDTTMETAVPVLERLRLAITNNRIPLQDGDPISITASFGVAAFPDDGNISADILGIADTRLYQAKRNGRNCIAGSDERTDTLRA